MLFYHFDLLDSFIKSNLITALNLEKENLREILGLCEKKKSNLLSITNTIIEFANSINTKDFDHFYDKISLLKQLFNHVNDMQMLALKLDENLTLTISLYDKSLENNRNEIKANLVEYNKQKDELSHKILAFENNYETILNVTMEWFANKPNKKRNKKVVKACNPFIENKIKINIELEPYDHNTLIVSEKEQKAFLPFFYSEVKEIFNRSNHRYQTLQDVVEDLYVVPLNRFKNSVISRFKESFDLIRIKEKGSMIKALDLGLELMFNYKLNPIIIAACRNLDELDIYLDCLTENELYDFTCFEIKFEVMPQLI